MSLNVLIDASVLLQPHAGIGTYTREIIRRFPDINPDLSMDLFLGHRWGRLDDVSTLLKGGTSASSAGEGAWRKTAKQIPGARQAWNAFKRYQFESGLSQRKADVLWAPCFMPPGWVDPAVITVHDLSHMRFHEFHPRNRLKWLDGLPQALEKASAIITISEFCQREIMEIFNVSESRISVIPNGVSEEFSPVSVEVGNQILKKYGLIYGQYFLSVCTLEPRKNLSTLVKAYIQLPEDIRQAVPLVLVGLSGWGRENLKTYMGELGVKGHLIFTGYVPQEDLPGLYGGATAFAYPSLYEGFGMPAIEALACGAISLLSDAEALIEVAGTAARHLPAKDVIAWRDAMVWTYGLKEEERSDLVLMGLQKSKIYSWDRTAQETLSLLENVAVRG